MCLWKLMKPPPLSQLHPPSSPPFFQSPPQSHTHDRVCGGHPPLVSCPSLPYHPLALTLARGYLEGMWLRTLVVGASRPPLRSYRHCAVRRMKEAVWRSSWGVCLSSCTSLYMPVKSSLVRYQWWVAYMLHFMHVWYWPVKQLHIYAIVYWGSLKYAFCSPLKSLSNGVFRSVIAFGSLEEKSWAICTCSLVVSQMGLFFDS